MTPQVVARDSLERANGWLNGGATLMQQMIAGPLGGFLFVIAASIPFLANAGTYAVSAILLATVAGSYRAVDSVARGAAAIPRRSIYGAFSEGVSWLMHQRILRTMALLIGLLNLALSATTAVLVLLAEERLHLGSIGFGALYTSMATGGILGSVFGDRIIKKVTVTWTVRIGLLIEAGMHLVLASSQNAYLVGFALLAFGIHNALWGIVSNSLRQRLTPPEMLGRVGAASMFIGAGGNCVGALLGGVVATKLGLTAPYWIAFGLAIAVTMATWRIFNQPTVASAYDSPQDMDPMESAEASAPA
jgi:MFS family permease